MKLNQLLQTITSPQGQGQYVLYLAVLPFYREYCMAELKDQLGDSCLLLSGDRQIDPTVRTGLSSELYKKVNSAVLFNRILVQTGGLCYAFRASTTVVDLNPRSLTAWMILLLRRAMGRRTLTWGHLHPRSGGQSRTAGIRRLMRRVSSGTILYGYDSVVPAKEEVEGLPVWVAPNSLYRASDMSPSNAADRNAFIYVGRLVKDKKVSLLLRAFAESGLAPLGAHLIFVGSGPERLALEAEAAALGVSKSVEFSGVLTSPKELALAYSRALRSVSPGYVGLSLTQSMGFGVPMLVSADEPHSPEIELERFGGVSYFKTNSIYSLAAALRDAWEGRSEVAPGELASRVRGAYSAEAMAEGLVAALQNRSQSLGDDGWPLQ